LLSAIKHQHLNFDPFTCKTAIHLAKFQNSFSSSWKKVTKNCIDKIKNLRCFGGVILNQKNTQVARKGNIKSLKRKQYLCFGHARQTWLRNKLHCLFPSGWFIYFIHAHDKNKKIDWT